MSNICERAYLGPAQALEYLAPLLQTRAENPHATLIMLFVNAVDESMTHVEKFGALAATATKCRGYFPPAPANPSPNGREVMSYLAAGPLFRDVDKIFDRQVYDSRDF